MACACTAVSALCAFKRALLTQIQAPCPHLRASLLSRARASRAGRHRLDALSVRVKVGWMGRLGGEACWHGHLRRFPACGCLDLAVRHGCVVLSITLCELRKLALDFCDGKAGFSKAATQGVIQVGITQRASCVWVKRAPALGSPCSSLPTSRAGAERRGRGAGHKPALLCVLPTALHLFCAHTVSNSVDLLPVLIPFFFRSGCGCQACKI